MKPEEINVAIAEACGWAKIHWYEDNAGPGFWSGIPYISDEEVFKLSETKLHHLRTYGDKLPNYYGDLNAIHEAEKILTPDQEEEYVERLSAAIMTEAYEDATADRWKKSNLASSDSTYRATAPQRATCLVKTLGKWVETKGERNA